ncbi:hypothetical protein B1P84_03215 [Enterococcus faecium]|nr:hypothetical protein B1P84_03215 [Enterococcus faecium]
MAFEHCLYQEVVSLPFNSESQGAISKNSFSCEATSSNGRAFRQNCFRVGKRTISRTLLKQEYRELEVVKSAF